mgnify:CR=1 FL=1
MRYKISDLAKLLDVSTNTVRRYEDMGYISAGNTVDTGIMMMMGYSVYLMLKCMSSMAFHMNR